MNLVIIKKELKEYDGGLFSVMEVCGSHTRAIASNGIPSMLSEKINLLSGPGCPVCVAPSAYIDKLIELSLKQNTTVVAFGDLLRVPGSSVSLSEIKGEGGGVEMVYSPMDVISMAQKEPGRKFVFAAIGFETTAPVFAELVRNILKHDIKNIHILSAIKTMPPAISFLMDSGAKIDAFLAPGHVSVITGTKAFAPLAEKYGIPFAVAGFSGERLLIALYDLLKNRGRGVVRNDYPSVVKEGGNEAAMKLVKTFFEPCSAVWRGLGEIPDSGLVLKKEYSFLDEGSAEIKEDHKKNPACICDKVLIGQKKPFECPLYGKVCTPLSPQGACMVSGEGSCFSYFSNQRSK